MANETPDNPKTMDVKKPGTSKPSATGRPLIVTSRPVMKDPMVTSSDDTASEKPAEKETPEPKNPSAAKKIIQPPSSAASLQSETATNDTLPPADNVGANEAQPTPATDDKPTTQLGADTTEKKPSAEEEADDTAIVNAVVDSAGQKKTEKQNDELADKKRQQNAQVLIESKKYNVPIGQVTQARKNRQIVFLAIFILILGVAYLLIDSGIADVPFDLPYKIFNNS